MNRSTLVVGSAWALSLAAAFLIGRGNDRPDERGPSADRERATEGRASSPLRSSPRTNSGPSRPDRAAGSDQALGLLAKSTPREAVVTLAQLPDPVERARGLLELLNTLEREEFLGVVADFRALGITEQRMTEYGMILHAWGKVDPEAALEYAIGNTGTPFARQTILASWAVEDPSAAITFARENHKGDGANPLLVGVIRGLAPGDLPGATDLLQELPYSRERGDALQSMLSTVMRDGADSALAWTDQLADDRLRSGALGYIIGNVSQSEPEKAASMLVELDDSSAAVRIADDVADSLARSDLDRAIAWSEGLQPDLRAEAVEGVISHYAAQDVQAASRWLESLPGDTNLDPAIRRFAWRSAGKNPELAASWIGAMQDGNLRNEMYQGVLTRWWQTDAEAAEGWIQSQADLPDSVRSLPDQWRQRRGADDRSGRNR